MITLAIAWREFRQFFTSWNGYVLILLYHFILGLILISSVQPGQPIEPAVIYSGYLTLALFTSPFITMRTIAGERQRGTLDLLQLSPISASHLVIGKWLGVLMLAMTIVGSALWLTMGTRFFANTDIGSILVAALGMMLVFSAALSIGVFASSLAGTLLASIGVASIFTLLLWLFGLVATTIETGLVSLPPQVLTVVRYLDLSSHFRESFAQGVIDSSDVMYFVSVTAIFLLLAVFRLQRVK